MIVDVIYMVMCVVVEFFFCKEKTAYEVRISDWSSDVCSSDLAACYMHAAARADTFRLLQFHRLESLLPAEIKDAMIVRPLIKDGNISPLFLRHRLDRKSVV